MKNKRFLASVIGAMIILAFHSYSNAENADDGKKEHCLSMSQIEQIEVLDSQTLLFHMHGDTDYINHLPSTCHGLKNNAFMHESSINSYCDLDIITVMDNSIGMRLGSCPLGEFETYIEPVEPQQ